MDHKNGAQSVRSAVFAALSEERAYQDQKYGPKNPAANSLGDFLCYLDTYVMSAKASLCEGDRDAVLHNLRKIAALGVAAMETHGVFTRSMEMQESFDTAANAAMEAAHSDPFNEFLKGARVTADQAQPQTQAQPQEQATDAPGVKFEGEAAHLPPEINDIIRSLTQELNLFGRVTVLMGPPPGFLFSPSFRRR